MGCPSCGSYIPSHNRHCQNCGRESPFYRGSDGGKDFDPIKTGCGAMVVLAICYAAVEEGYYLGWLGIIMIACFLLFSHEGRVTLIVWIMILFLLHFIFNS